MPVLLTEQAVLGLALGFCELLGLNINGSENINFTSNHLALTFGKTLVLAISRIENVAFGALSYYCCRV
jgi:hypothetical protein